VPLQGPAGFGRGSGNHSVAVRPAPTLLCLSYRDVAELMAERGIILTYEAVRYGRRKFGQVYTLPLRRQHPKPGDPWPPSITLPTAAVSLSCPGQSTRADAAIPHWREITGTTMAATGASKEVPL